MTGNEQKMRAVLRAEASTVLPSADAWTRIQDGVARQRRRRHWMQYGGLAAAASAAAVVTVLAFAGDGTPEPRVTHAPASQPPATQSGAPEPSTTPNTSPRMSASPTPPPVVGPPDSFVAVVQIRDAMRLAVLDASTGDVVRDIDWKPGDFGINEADVSPDRRWIYTIKSLGDACQATIIRIPLAGGPAEDVIDETGVDGAEVFSMALSGDGKRVAYLRNPQCDGGGESTTELVVVDVTTGREVQRLKHRDPAPHGWPRGIVWQPGTDRLAVVFAGAGPQRVGLLDLSTAEDISDVTVVVGHDRSCHLGNVTFSGDQLFASENCEPGEQTWTSTVVQFDSSSGKLADRGPAYKDRYVVSMDADPTGQALIYAMAEGKDGTTERRWVYRLELAGGSALLKPYDTRVDHLTW